MESCGANYVLTYKGHRTPTNSFLDFFAVTLDDVASKAKNFICGWPKEMPYYNVFLASFLTLFRSMRAAEIVAVNGYPLDGYALLRNAKDQTGCILGAIAGGLSSFSDLHGGKGLTSGRKLTSAEMDKVLGNRKKEEHRIRRHIEGGQRFGFSHGPNRRVTTLGSLFNYEVHGGRLHVLLNRRVDI